MNYCRKCQSDYEKPGTCNCFAEQAPREDVAPVAPIYLPVLPLYPGYPWHPSAPTYPVYPWWQYQPTCGGEVTVTYTPSEGTTWYRALPVDPNAPTSVYITGDDIAEMHASGRLSYTGGGSA
jgi:hypothetical protein